MEIRVTISVSTLGNKGTGGVWSSGSVGCGVGSPIPPGSPPIARYVFYRRPRPGAVVLSKGKDNVYYTRKTYLPGQVPAGCTPDSGGPKESHIAYYFSRLAGASLRFDPTPKFSRQWHSPDSYVRDLNLIQEQVHSSFISLLDALVKSDALTLQERFSLSPKIKYVAHDLRDDPSPPLPTVVLNDSIVITRNNR